LLHNHQAQVVSEVEPSIVIPMHYKTEYHDEKAFGMLSPVDVFLKAMGKEQIAPQPKLVVTKDRLPAELQVVVLE
jgi:L-ascorbate metabolism protein UlaG (beta-lactamase superfamily)